jgi:hypothetical protein
MNKMGWKKVMVGISVLTLILSVFIGMGIIPVRAQDAGGIVNNVAPVVDAGGDLALTSPSGTTLDNATDGEGVLPALFPQSTDTLIVTATFFDANSEDIDGTTGGETMGTRAGGELRIYEDSNYDGNIDWGVADQLVRTIYLDHGGFNLAGGYDPATYSGGVNNDEFVWYGGGDSTDGVYSISDGAQGVTAAEDDYCIRVDQGTSLRYSVTGFLHGARLNLTDDDVAAGPVQTALFRCYQLWKVFGVYDDNDAQMSAAPAFNWDFNSTNPGASFGVPANTYVYSSDPTGTDRWALVIQWLAPANFAELTIGMDAQFEPPGTLAASYGIDTATMDWRVGEDSAKANPVGEEAAPGSYPISWNTTWPDNGAGDLNGGQTITCDIDNDGGNQVNNDFRQYDILWFIYTVGNDPAIGDGATGIGDVLPDADYTSAVALGAAAQ